MLIAPALSSFLFRKGAAQWRNPLMEFLTNRYRTDVRWAIRNRWLTVGVGGVLFLLAIYLAFGGVIGSEFLPHLDEGAIWVRGTLAPSTGPTEALEIVDKDGSYWPHSRKFRGWYHRWGGPMTALTQRVFLILSTS
jgi:cobalt-zinc-cadmium resistance protein CzcA